VEAAKLISAAHSAENAEQYRDAVSSYKSAVRILLQGVQGAVGCLYLCLLIDCR